MISVTGPFDVKWGDNTVVEVEEISVDYSQDSEDYQTVQHNTHELDGAIKASATITLLENDVPALAALLPQYFVDDGEVMSTGETVNHADGAVDVAAAACDENPVYNDLDIISCANPGHVFRLVSARTKIDSVEFDDKVRKVMIKFVGEPGSGEGSIQFFREGTIAVVS